MHWSVAPGASGSDQDDPPYQSVFLLCGPWRPKNTFSASSGPRWETTSRIRSITLAGHGTSLFFSNAAMPHISRCYEPPVRTPVDCESHDVDRAPRQFVYHHMPLPAFEAAGSTAVDLIIGIIEKLTEQEISSSPRARRASPHLNVRQAPLARVMHSAAPCRSTTV